MNIKEIYQTVIETFDYPFVIKPNQEGSTLGLTFVHQQEEVEKALHLAFSHDDQLIVEDFVEGRELTVSVFGDQVKKKLCQSLKLSLKINIMIMKQNIVKAGVNILFLQILQSR